MPSLAAAEPIGRAPRPAPCIDGEERWLPLPGEAGLEIEALARAALGDTVPPPPPEPDLDFNLLEETDEPDAESVPLEEEENEEEPEEEAAVPPLPTTETSTAAEAAARLNLPKSGHMEVACPTCSTTGLVPWDRLDGMLCCSGCWTWFRIGGNGQIAVVDPPAASQGALRLYSRNGPDRTVMLQPELLEEKRRTARRQRRWGWVGALMSGLPIKTLLLLLLLGGLTYGGARWWSKPQVVKLPVALDQRAELLAESWLKHDTPVMVRMAHPNCRGITRRWAFDHQPPLTPGQFNRRKTVIDVRILRQDTDTADIEVRVDLSGLNGAAEPTVWQQRWRSHQGTWLFHPNNEPLPQAPKGAAAKTKKRPR